MYKMKTTFWMDFTIADIFGLEAIEDTYDRAFMEWKTDVVYLTELSMVCNWKIFEWYKKNEEYAELYDKLWRKTDEYAMEHLRGGELSYYIRITD